MFRNKKFSTLSADESYHNIFVNGDWDLEKIANVFGDIPKSLPKVLHRSSCSVPIVKLLIKHGVEINGRDEFDQSPLMIAIGITQDEAVVQELLKAGADVNFVVNGESILTLYLGKYFDKCSINIVKLLLTFNTDVNFLNSSGYSPLTIALKNSRDEEIIQALLEKGARVDTLNGEGKSPLCISFRYSSSDIVKLLLVAGSPQYACTYHRSPLHCATDFSYAGLSEDILNLLLNANSHVNKLDKYGQSVLCYALQHGAQAHSIQLLLDVGALLNACTMHSGTLICATSCRDAPLRKDVVQLLLDNGACVGSKGKRVIQHALSLQKYETGAIKLLLDLPGIDACIETCKTLLHLALRSTHCKLETIKLLVKHNVPMHSEDVMKNTPLHIACQNRCNPSIINFLLKNGSDVNAKNNCEDTPLVVAVESQCHADTLKELLLGGVHIGRTLFYISKPAKSEYISKPVKGELLELLARQWESSVQVSGRLSCNKMLLKFYLLQNPEFNLSKLKHYLSHEICYPHLRPNTIKLEIFFNECLCELQKIDLLLVGHGRLFVNRANLSVEKSYDFNQALMILSKNSFPIYFDVISAKIDRSFMEAKLNNIQVYINKIDPVERVILKSLIVHEISKYLPNNGLLKFIFAFYIPVELNEIEGAGKVDPFLPGKRKCPPMTKLPKCLKLQN